MSSGHAVCQQLPDLFPRGIKGCWQFLGVFTTGLRHVRPSAAASADYFGR
jgi:hypothetical protein